MTEEMGLQTYPETDIDDADVTFSGRIFHSRAAATEKLDCRWFKDDCVGQQAMMSKQSGDADEPRQQVTGGIPHRDTAELSGVVGICTPEQPA